MFNYSHARWVSKLRWKLGYFKRKRILRQQKKSPYQEIKYECWNYPKATLIRGGQNGTNSSTVPKLY